MKCLSDLGRVLGSWCWLCAGDLGSELGLQGGGDQAGGFDGGDIRLLRRLTQSYAGCLSLVIGGILSLLETKQGREVDWDSHVK